MTTSVPSTTVVDDIDDEALDNAVEKRLGFGFWVAISWIGLVSLAALLAPWLPIADPNEIANGAPRDGILGDNFMGSDALGRDVFARTIWGARISLGVGFLGILLGVVVGGALWIAAGYFKGLADQIISFVVFSLLSFPSLVLALLITASLSRSFLTVAMTLGIVGIAPISRLARATTIQFAEREFVQAAVLAGQADLAILFRQVLPNTLSPLIVTGSLLVATAILIESALSFLGLGAPNLMSWGFMVGAGRSFLRDAWWLVTIPGIAILLTVLSINLVGEGLNDALNPRLADL